MKINKKSWHYQVAQMGNNKVSFYRGSNTCEYISSFIKGVLGILLLLVLSGLFLFCFVWLPVQGVYELHACSGGYYSCYEIMLKRDSAGIFGLLFVVVYTAAAVIALGTYTLRKVQPLIDRIFVSKVERFPNGGTGPGVMSQLYRSWVDRICIKIDFTND